MTPSREEPVERDARESAPWFAALPAEHQRAFRADWAREQERWVEVHRLDRAARRRCVLEGALLFGAGTLVSGLGFVGALGALLAGALVGVLWWYLSAEALLAPLIAMPAFFYFHVLAVTSGMGSLGSGFGFARFAFVAFALGGISSYLASRRWEPD